MKLSSSPDTYSQELRLKALSNVCLSLSFCVFLLQLITTFCHLFPCNASPSNVSPSRPGATIWTISLDVFSGALGVVYASHPPSLAIWLANTAFFTCSKFHKVAYNIPNKNPVPEAWHSRPFFNWPQSAFPILFPTAPPPRISFFSKMSYWGTQTIFPDQRNQKPLGLHSDKR